MARIVTVGTNQVIEGKQDLGDIVSVHGDGTPLGDGYAESVIIEAPKISVKKIMASLNALLPETRHVLLPKEDRKRLDWKDSDGKWYEVKKRPKFNWSLASLGVSDMLDLTSAISSDEDKEKALVKVGKNLPSLAVNKETLIGISAIG